MEILYENCCGLDVHKKTIVACMINGKAKEIVTFGTMTEDILDLVDWIKSKECQCVAMESTGVYWKPVYNLLEVENMKALVVNAQHIKNVPGRKTDIKDAEWIADLLKHGLLKGSFIPPREQRELKELVRYRRSIIQERTSESARVQKVLEGANIKLASVASNVLGVSGRAMLDAIISGTEKPEELSALAKGALKKKIPELQRALKGLIGDHQRMILAAQLRHIDFLNEEIEALSGEIAKRLSPDEESIELIESIPGIGRKSAEHIIAEIGTNMDQFPSAAHLSSWAGVVPGCNESAGKKKRSALRKGNEFLRSTLVESAKAASHTKDTYLSAQYHRIAARRGANRACIAVAHSMLTIIYHVLKKRKPYEELGSDFFNKLNEKNVVKRATKILESMGYEVAHKEEA